MFNSLHRPVTAPLPIAPPKPNSPIYGRPAIASPRHPIRQPSPQQPPSPEPIAEEIQTDAITPPEYQRHWRRNAEDAGLTPADNPVGWVGEVSSRETRRKNKMETRYRPVKEVNNLN